MDCEPLHTTTSSTSPPASPSFPHRCLPPCLRACEGVLNLQIRSWGRWAAARAARVTPAPRLRPLPVLSGNWAPVRGPGGGDGKKMAAAALSLASRIKLAQGGSIPYVALGTWKMNQAEAVR